MTCHVCWGRDMSRLNFINAVKTFYIYNLYCLRILGSIKQLQQRGQCAVASEELILIHWILFVKPAKSSILHFLCCPLWLCCFYSCVSICYCQDSNVWLDTCVWCFGNLPVIGAMNCRVFVIQWLMKFNFSNDLHWQRKQWFPCSKIPLKRLSCRYCQLRRCLRWSQKEHSWLHILKNNMVIIVTLMKPRAEIWTEF